MYKVFSKFITAFCLLSLISINYAEAAKKGSKEKEGSDKKPNKKNGIDISKMMTTEVEIKKGKKKIKKLVYCYNKKAGTLISGKKSSTFKTYSEQMHALEDKESTPRNRAKMSELAQLKILGGKACKQPVDSLTPLPPAPGTIPDWLSMEPYTGPFGEAEARLLYDRFAFGARPGQAELAAQEGLEAAVNRLTTYVPDPNLDLAVGDLACDGEIEAEGDKDDRACEPEGVYTPGVRYGIYRRILRSESPFFEKFAMFLHDERMAAGINNLEQEDRFTIMPHVNLIRRAAISGDYKQFMRDWNDDDLGHRLWLDGGVNNGFNPNQNYAREFWELGTVGPTDSTGKPVYDTEDIIQASLAFSGRWNSYHAVGPKVIFHGTPWQKTVENAEDVMNATFEHPRTAIHLAEDLWKEFINPKTTPEAVEALAAIIRSNNYNLIPVFKTIMKSKAMFNSQKTLIKHPMELVLGFMRQTGIPVSYQNIDNILNSMGQRPLLPPTVFGWYEERLAGEAYVFDTVNGLAFLTRDGQEWQKRKYSLLNLVGVSDPNVAKTPIVVDRITKALNLNLDESHKQRLIQYLDYDLAACSKTVQDKGLCFTYNGKSYYLRDNIYNPTQTGESYVAKTQYFLQLLATLPDYKVK